MATNLRRIPVLSRLFGVPWLWVKDESLNPSGTHKDRRTKDIIRDAKRDGVRTLVIVTSGNAGRSLGLACRKAKMKSVCFNVNSQRLEVSRALARVCDAVVRVPAFRVVLPTYTCRWALRHGFPGPVRDVTVGYEGAYAAIIDEVKHVKPDYIVVPVGTGSTFIGLARRIEELGLACRVVGVGESRRETIADKIKGRVVYWSKIRPFLRRGHRYVKVSDEEIRQAMVVLGNRVRHEPTSAAAFAGLWHIPGREKMRVVVLNTGRGM